MTRTGSGVYYDPYDLDINADPYPVYARLREQAPLYYNEEYDFWALSRHADVEGAVSNHAALSHRYGAILEMIRARMVSPPGNVLGEDPPLHPMHRKLMSRVFTPKKMNALEEQTRGVLRLVPRPTRRGGEVRLRQGPRQRDADASHRHAARHTRIRSERRARLRRPPAAHRAGQAHGHNRAEQGDAHGQNVQ